MEFLKTSKISVCGINIGPVHKADVRKASVMLEHDAKYAVILAFDVKIEREAQSLADDLGVRIFKADIIYHLFDEWTAYLEDLKKKEKELHKHEAIFPVRMKILPQFVFNTRDPIVCGVKIEAGSVRLGTPIAVPSKENLEIGIVSGIESNKVPVEIAKAGEEVCVKIDALPSQAPKLYGRHFDEHDELVSKVTRESIDILKEFFRDEMSASDWKIIIELKKVFDVL